MWGRSIDDTGYDRRVLEMAWGLGNSFWLALASKRPMKCKCHIQQHIAMKYNSL